MKGYTKLELLRDNKVVHRVEKHNTVTGFLENASGRGNFHLIANRDKILPVLQWYNGCLLTDNDNDPLQMMIAGDSDIVACGGNDAYGGTYTPRGSFNQIESGEIAGGYRFVWDWNTSQGNGRIKSVCLTRSNIGKVEIRGADKELVDNITVNEYMGDVIATPNFEGLNIVDYEREIGYSVNYDTEESKIYVRRCRLNTKLYHITGDAFNIIPDSWEEMPEISQVINRWNTTTRCINYSSDGSEIRLITWRNTAPSESDLTERNLYIYTINTTTWACVPTSYRFENVAFQATWNTSYLLRDVIRIVDGHVWAYANNGKIVSCNLSVPTDIIEYDSPLGQTGVEYNGTTFALANGDWYKFGQNQSSSIKPCLYYHNGEFYKCNCLGTIGTYNSIFGVTTNNYGTQLRFESYNGMKVALTTIYPYVSTVNNLDAPVIKTSNVTMKLTYEITET